MYVYPQLKFYQSHKLCLPPSSFLDSLIPAPLQLLQESPTPHLKLDGGEDVRTMCLLAGYLISESKSYELE